MHSRRGWIAYAVFGILLVGLGAILLAPHISTTPPAPRATSGDVRTVQIAGETLRVAIADTEALRERGLGGRESLSQDEGMLFVFPKDGKYAFWMKDMNFPIDILWLSDTGVVVYMVSNVSPNTYPEDFVPEKPSRYVLELPSGWANAHEVQLGGIVQL